MLPSVDGHKMKAIALMSHGSEVKTVISSQNMLSERKRRGLKLADSEVEVDAKGAESQKKAEVNIVK